MLTLWMQMSLDGYAASPGGALDWPVVEEELHGHFVAELRQADAFHYGRKVFEMMAAFWPTADEIPGATHNQAEYARIWRPMPKRVYSKTLAGDADPGWNATVASEIGPADGRNVLFGGPEIASRFIAEGLIDEYRLFVHPVALGDGAPLFLDRTKLTLVSARTFDSKVVALHYER
jgi:dihydrofolate reductase